MKRTALQRRTPLARTARLPAMSAKRRRESAIYAKKRRAFLAANATCWAWMRLANDEDFALMRTIWGDGFLRAQPSDDVHHTAGRHGGNYLEESTWMAVSRLAHDWITAHPKEAEARGWIVRAKPASAFVEPRQAAADLAHDTATKSHAYEPDRPNFHE